MREHAEPIAAAEEIAAAVRAKQKYPQAAVEEAAERVRSGDDGLRAWVCLDPLAARKALDTGRGDERLAGVPFGVKDLIDVAGLPSALGLSEDEYKPAAALRNAAAVQRLEAEGAVALGKTVTSALAFDRPGPTRNPLALERTPGASSSGSAAAVAAGMVPLALGSQAVGSVIRPASYCGVWAFVPSRGSVPSEGSLVLSQTLDRIGVLASSPSGLRLAAQVLCSEADEPARDGRIAVLAGGELAQRAAEPSACLARLARTSSDTLRPLELDIDWSAVLEATRIIAAFEFHAKLDEKRPPIASLDMRLIAALAPARPDEQAYRGALQFGERLTQAWDRAVADFDAVLLPSAADEAPAGPLDDQDPAPAALGSLLGLPAVNVPIFTSRSGLPLGCQLLGRRKADLTAVALAARLASGIAEQERRHA
ncbi:MAG: amidase family protein [Parvibaculaceae bacterium]